MGKVRKNRSKRDRRWRQEGSGRREKGEGKKGGGRGDGWTKLL
jgi:hypothetical protein